MSQTLQESSVYVRYVLCKQAMDGIECLGTLINGDGR